MGRPGNRKTSPLGHLFHPKASAPYLQSRIPSTSSQPAPPTTLLGGGNGTGQCGCHVDRSQWAQTCSPCQSPQSARDQTTSMFLPRASAIPQTGGIGTGQCGAGRFSSLPSRTCAPCASLPFL